MRVAAGGLPILALDLDRYADWSTLVIVLDRLTADLKEVDEAGVADEWDRGRPPVSFFDDGGWIVLSMVDTAASGTGARFNVVIHEAVNRLDALDGGLNAQPPQHDGRLGALVQPTRVYALCESRDDLAMASYAADAPEEFFSVASKFVFELPETVADEHPAI